MSPPRSRRTKSPCREASAVMRSNPYDIEATAAAIARAYAMPLEERKDRWNALMAVLRANSIHDWTAHFLQALANEHEGMIDDPLIEDARLPATVGLSRTLPLPASLGGIRGAHL
jgi:trehalose 6-phosphate synthase